MNRAGRKSTIVARGIGKDMASGFLDVAKLVSGTNFGQKTPYDKLAARIGDVVYADMHGWKIYLRDMKAEVGGTISMAQVLGNQIGPMMRDSGVDEGDVEALLNKVPISLGKKKTVPLMDVIPAMCIRDLLRELEDAARDL